MCIKRGSNSPLFIFKMALFTVHECPRYGKTTHCHELGVSMQQMREADCLPIYCKYLDKKTNVWKCKYKEKWNKQKEAGKRAKNIRKALR